MSILSNTADPTLTVPFPSSAPDPDIPQYVTSTNLSTPNNSYSDKNWSSAAFLGSVFLVFTAMLCVLSCIAHRHGRHLQDEENKNNDIEFAEVIESEQDNFVGQADGNSKKTEGEGSSTHLT